MIEHIEGLILFMLGSIRTRGLGPMYSYYQIENITPLIGFSPIDVTVVMFFNEEHNALCLAKGVGSSQQLRRRSYGLY